MQLLNFRKFGFLFVILLSSALIVVSCGDEDEDPDTCDTEGLTYDNFAQDFLITNCATLGGCHVEANKDVSGVGSYETYEDAKAVVDEGRLLGAINHMDGFSNMPKGEEKLSDCDIDRLTAWVNDGAPE